MREICRIFVILSVAKNLKIAESLGDFRRFGRIAESKLKKEQKCKKIFL
ncbi:hypothetical protein [Helicobacter sp. 23-1045]